MSNIGSCQLLDSEQIFSSLVGIVGATCNVTGFVSEIGILLLFLLLMSQTEACQPAQYWKQQCGDNDFHWTVVKKTTCECGQLHDLYKNNIFSHWCCVNNSSKCIGKGNWDSIQRGFRGDSKGDGIFLVGSGKSPAWTDGVSCPDGTPIKLDESCYGRCNFDPQNQHRSPLSTVAPCKNTSVCVKETTWSVDKLVNGGRFEMRLCNGQFRCEDKGDLDWCKAEERRNELCPILNGNSLNDCGQKKCTSDSQRCSGVLPGQCFDQSERTIQKSSYVDIFFSCLDRSDLIPCVVEKQDAESGAILDFEKIESCERRVKRSRNDISTAWLNVGMSEEQQKRNQDTTLPGLRCNQGNEGCLPRSLWCMGPKVRVYLETKVNLPRNATICQLLDNRNAAEDPELCGNYQFWSKHPCPEISGKIPVFRCLGRFNGQCNFGVGGTAGKDIAPDFPSECEDGSLKFTSRMDRCEEENKCKVKGRTVCIRKASRCDLVPLCDDGRDEHNCKEEYVRKGLIQCGADFECKSREYNPEVFPNASITMWAVRCDGNPTCWMNRDEKGCNLGNIIYYVIGNSKVN